ncbi:enoyl-CoA hydratase/isomerase family protein [Woodsholea maritima]|uniref:enoyl-CoA hydratase/isomerase family protein n=1 Tax=Woodsholea maritima TaxID=240237 RepID=UPI0003751AAB|nr:enoyl-CoA hydratase/isomerase family protein [Woodsholea maritima]
MSEIIAGKVGQIGRITLNRPQALNALTHDMCLEMTKALLAWKDDGEVKAVLVDAAGEKAFCAGGDIRLLAESGTAKDTRAYEFWRDEYRLNVLIQEYPKPFIALIDGITMGGGVGISMPGSHRVAGDRTMLAMPETGIGYFPDVGGSYFLSHLPGELGTWMGLSGARLKTADVLASGIATHYVPSDKHAALIEDLQKAHLDEEGEALEATLEAHAGDAGSSDWALARGLVDAAFIKDSVEAILARLDAAGDSWSTKQAAILRTKSPFAMKVTLAALHKGAKMSFREVMKQDLRLSMHFLTGVDFYEGVRAVILDKDNNPQWSPKTLSEVSAQAVNAMFEPLDDDQELTFIGE